MSPYTNKKRLFLSVFLLVSLSLSVSAVDFWQYPEAADRDSIFVGVLAASFAFNFNDFPSSEFSFAYPEFFFDYVLPVGLPFSIGVSIDTLRTDQYGLGLRPAYHINFDMPGLDVYAMYSINVDISETRMVISHGLRAGFRYVLFSVLCLNVESGYMLQSLNFGISVKLH